jgi:hypothetical protein
MTLGEINLLRRDSETTNMKLLRSFEISFARTMSQPSLNASSDGASHKVCYVRVAGWINE